MAKATFTPGPWFPESSGDEVWVTPQLRSEPVICDIVPRSGERGWSDEDLSNADLIASAPDLYAALEALEASVSRMVARLDSEPGNQTTVSLWLIQVRAAREALAKARGE